jgi:outer membrane protein assembly factor BamB
MWQAMSWVVGLLIAGTPAWLPLVLADQPPPWPQFRGPQGDGHAPACRNLPETLDVDRNLVWQIEVPGTGWSSPVADDQSIWVTTAIPVTDNPAGDAAGLELVLLAYDRRTGQTGFQIKLFDLPQPDLIHSLNSYASPTPCLDQDNIYCHFGTYGTAAVRRRDGQVLWRNQQIRLEHSTGPGSSPICHENKLIFHADGMDSQSIVALDCQTGEIAWQALRSGTMSAAPDQKKAFCTPQIVSLEGQTLLLSPAANWLYVYDPADGRERFKVPYGELGYSTVPRPVVCAEQAVAFICTGFDRSRLLCIDIRPAAAAPADVGTAANGTSEPGQAVNRIRWTVDQRMPTMPSPLLVDDQLYLISDAGIATCVDSRSGEVQWTERLKGKFAASPLLADGKIYLGNQAGECFVLRPGSECEIIASSQLDSAIMASPLAVDNELYIRTAKQLYLFANP